MDARTPPLGPAIDPIETKPAYRTTEFWVYIVMLLGLLIAGLATGGDGPEGDALGAGRVWLYAVILTVGYLVSRGLAKVGSETRDIATRGRAASSITDRVRTAAHVLTDGPEAVRAEAPTETGPPVRGPVRPPG
ncbi:MAG: hypothetical protein QOG62_36 [Thermoleophilaceae bacterium]|nr:hypothetical protein [Thermoleophilaceae bacterium]